MNRDYRIKTDDGTYYFQGVSLITTHRLGDTKFVRSIAPKLLSINKIELDKNRTIYKLRQSAVPLKVINDLKILVQDEDILSINNSLFYT